MKKTLIISAFPGTGKTTLYNSMEKLKDDIIRPEQAEQFPISKITL